LPERGNGDLEHSVGRQVVLVVEHELRRAGDAAVGREHLGLELDRAIDEARHAVPGLVVDAHERALALGARRQLERAPQEGRIARRLQRVAASRARGGRGGPGGVRRRVGDRALDRGHVAADARASARRLPGRLEVLRDPDHRSDRRRVARRAQRIGARSDEGVVLDRAVRVRRRAERAEHLAFLAEVTALAPDAELAIVVAERRLLRELALVQRLGHVATPAALRLLLEADVLLIGLRQPRQSVQRSRPLRGDVRVAARACDRLGVHGDARIGHRLGRREVVPGASVGGLGLRHCAGEEQQQCGYGDG
jgi:hypothetical protein